MISCLLLCTLLTIQQNSADRDGTHDFDWDIGTWKVHQRRLLHPLSGSTTWVEYNGTDTVQQIFTGANMGKVESSGPAGHLEIYTLRLYNPDAHVQRRPRRVLRSRSV